ncbi:RNA 2'-phosphotransferase [Kordiimonas sp. SCSIO 12610]|uniref:RNA 2'-phosphotransferase n=1 Tax=Kordiimonas sp. SCSIO 12610 TaxID=2829597 RepID=UPI00210CC26C|nr:RNA 2'-phosphotransferase [Kordiimonas sp. SCSIO 12610]UTW56123.1 RNA 2'-phosphotransferase [Kordiimonas sp. SCSIO 12610]
MTNTTKTSKFLSYILRHRPDAIGLTLSKEGWASIDELIAKAKSEITLNREMIEHAVTTNEKQRFILSEDGQYIRANQGHSIKVDLGLQATDPPDTLFHGTVEKFIPPIREQGLLKGTRQHVHLSKDRETAVIVAKRRGKPVILKIMANQMHLNGHDFYLSENGVWLTDHVPVNYIDFA